MTETNGGSRERRVDGRKYSTINRFVVEEIDSGSFAGTTPSKSPRIARRQQQLKRDQRARDDAGAAHGECRIDEEVVDERKKSTEYAKENRRNVRTAPSKRSRRRRQVRRYVFDRRSGSSPSLDRDDDEGDRSVPVVSALRRAVLSAGEIVHDTFCPEDVTSDYWTYAKVRFLSSAPRLPFVCLFPFTASAPARPCSPVDNGSTMRHGRLRLLFVARGIYLGRPLTACFNRSNDPFFHSP